MIEYLDAATRTTVHQIVHGFVVVFAIALFMNGVGRWLVRNLLDGSVASMTISWCKDVFDMKWGERSAAWFPGPALNDSRFSISVPTMCQITSGTNH